MMLTNSFSIKAATVSTKQKSKLIIFHIYTNNFKDSWPQQYKKQRTKKKKLNANHNWEAIINTILTKFVAQPHLGASNSSGEAE